MALSGTSLSFAAQQVGTTSSAQHVTVTNAGNAAMNISSLISSGDFAQTNNCGTGLAAAASCTVNVTFTPTAAGTRTGSVTITDSAAGSPHSISLTGSATTGPPPPTPDFTLSLTPGSSTITAGQSASFSLTIGSSGGFSQAVSLSCSGAPAGSTCSVTPGSANPNGGSVTAQVSVTSTARGALFAPQVNTRFPDQTIWLAALLGGLAFLIVLFMPKRRLRFALALPAFALLAFAVTGCGSTGGSSNTTTPSTTSGTPAGSYTLTVAGTSGSQSHSATVTVVVK
jgi:hypothetical protein